MKDKVHCIKCGNITDKKYMVKLVYDYISNSGPRYICNDCFKTYKYRNCIAVENVNVI